METRIALLRGVNVGGRSLPMAELREDLRSLGLDHVRTYIQSGNVVFRVPGTADDAALADRIADAVVDRHGFRPQVLVLSAGRLRHAMEANPFPEAESDPRTLHLYFLAASPGDADLAGLEELATATERFRLRDRVFYLHAPEGFGRSKLAAKVESVLGVPATARNWRTVTRLWELVEGADGPDGS